MPTIQRFHIRLLVTRFRECFRFYRDILALPVRYGDENADYAEFKSGGVHLALFRRHLMAEVLATDGLPAASPAQDTAAIVLRVADAAETYTELTAKGAEFTAPPADRPLWGCRTAHLRDPDGNLIEFNSDL